MKSTWSIVFFLLVHSATLAFASGGGNGHEPEALRTEAPQFKAKDPSGKVVDHLPLKKTIVNVDIAGMIADVHVTQEYRNDGKQPLAATYIFPASAHAAVYAMEMTIGTRKVTAQIKKKEQARREFEQAKQNGQTASLLEEQRPNVFSMDVANILPGDVILVDFHYTETLIPEQGEYEFWFPATFGDGYYKELPSASAGLKDNYIDHASAQYGKNAGHIFEVHVRLEAGMPVSQIACTSHPVLISKATASTVFVNPDPAQVFRGDKGFRLLYSLRGQKTETGMLLYEGEDENFFMAMIQPPAQFTQDDIPPREYVFIVDVSGSMTGWPIETSKSLMRKLLANLKEYDRFNLVLFAGDSRVLFNESQAPTPVNLSKAESLLSGETAHGGTELLTALATSFALKGTAGYSRTFIVITDGFITAEREAFDLVKQNLNQANLFAFGISNSVNKFLIDGLARAGMGEPIYITQEGQNDAAVEKFVAYCGAPLLRNVKASFQGMDVYGVEPIALPDMLAERPILIFGKYKGKANGTLTLEGKTAKGDFKRTLAATSFSPLPENRALRYLWARHRIATLGDYHAAGFSHEKEITELGLKYNLLTEFTSFVAVDQEVRAQSPVTQAAMQSSGSTPEPHEWALIFLLGLLAIWIIRNRIRHA